MNKHISLIFVFLILASNISNAGTIEYSLSGNGPKRSIYSPDKFYWDYCLPLSLSAAKYKIYIITKNITNKNIAETLKKCHRKGIEIRIILDNTAPVENGNLCKGLADAGIPVYYRDKNTQINFEGNSRKHMVIIDNENWIVGTKYLGNYGYKEDDLIINHEFCRSVIDSYTIKFAKEFHFLKISHTCKMKIFRDWIKLMSMMLNGHWFLNYRVLSGNILGL